jgi:hypothetical protein
MGKSKKHKQTQLTTMQEFRAILKDNGSNQPTMFIQTNTVITDDPLAFYRDSAGRYTIQGFKQNSEPMINLETTEIYFGKGNAIHSAKWVHFEGVPNHDDITIMTQESNWDGTYTPADGLLNYDSIHIIFNP